MSQTPDGIGNKGKFVNRIPRVCAAGLPTRETGDHRLTDCFKQYLIQDEIDAVLGDAIIPHERLHKPNYITRKEDKRHASINTSMKLILNPPKQTKFQELANEMKSTTYSSFWKKNLGGIPDPIPMLPEGMNIYKTKLGKPTPVDNITDIIAPKLPPIDEAPNRRAAYQTDRHYCKPPFSRDKVYGIRTHAANTSKQMKCCLTDDRQGLGTALASVVNSKKADFDKTHINRLASTLVTKDIIAEIPKDFTFGKVDTSPFSSVESCLCEGNINPNKQCIKECFSYLNSLRKYLSKRYDLPFFRKLYLSFKYFDKGKSGWLPKNYVYNYCAYKLVEINSKLIEPLLFLWDALSNDKERLEYKTFVDTINYQVPSRSLPKIAEIPEKFLNVSTTYTDMVKPSQNIDTRQTAGVPSGRYLDMDYPVIPPNYCKAFVSYLPGESNVKSCLCPSLLSLLGISHRDMYAARSPEIVRRVFEGAGEKLTDDEFKKIWNAAKKYHSQGFVCYETFHRAINENSHN